MNKAITFAAAWIILGSTYVLADYCSRCKDLMRDASIGVCENCRQEKTTSAANKLCPDCSHKLKECETCRAKLTPPTTQPTK